MCILHQLVDAFSRLVCYTTGDFLTGTSRDEKARHRKEGHDDELLAASRGRIAPPGDAATVDAFLAWCVLRLSHRCHRLSFHVWRFFLATKPGSLRTLAGALHLVSWMYPRLFGVLARSSAAHLGLSADWLDHLDWADYPQSHLSLRPLRSLSATLCLPALPRQYCWCLHPARDFSLEPGSRTGELECGRGHPLELACGRRLRLVH